MNPGRPPLPTGQAKSDLLPTVRMKPVQATKFRRVCKKLHLTRSEAVRQAVDDFVEKHG